MALLFTMSAHPNNIYTIMLGWCFWLNYRLPTIFWYILIQIYSILRNRICHIRFCFCHFRFRFRLAIKYESENRIRIFSTVFIHFQTELQDTTQGLGWYWSSWVRLSSCSRIQISDYSINCSTSLEGWWGTC
jgi:hypothetical protein